MADAQKEQKQFGRRLAELAGRACRSGAYTYTGFLSLQEQSDFHQLEKEKGKEFADAGYALWGGAPSCERQMLRFGTASLCGYEEEFPIRCICIKPAAPKFADRLTHRDFLGALMNLGIERRLLGDIFIKDNTGYLYCADTIADFLMQNLAQVKHTHVICSLYDAADGLACAPDMLEKTIHISSERIDGILAKLYGMPRGGAIEQIQAKKAFINGRLCEHNSAQLKEGDVVTLRGYGKFCYGGILSVSKKGKLCAVVKQYGSQ